MRYQTFVSGSCFLALAPTMCLAAWLVVSMAARQQLAIGQAAFDAIEIGMTQESVESMLGGPPGDYTNGRFGVLQLT